MGPIWARVTSEMIQRRRYRVRGQVQGVGFRAYVWRNVQRLEVSGWVRNRFDGTVEVLADASLEDHQNLLAILEQGPSLSRVDGVGVDSESRELEDLLGFAVVPDA